MRALLAGVLLCACSSTVDSKQLLKSERAGERCEAGALIASAFPGRWPDVVIEVREQRDCAVEIKDTFAVTPTTKVRGVGTVVAGLLGATLGVVADVALTKATQRTYYATNGEE